MQYAQVYMYMQKKERKSYLWISICGGQQKTCPSFLIQERKKERTRVERESNPKVTTTCDKKPKGLKKKAVTVAGHVIPVSGRLVN